MPKTLLQTVLVTNTTIGHLELLARIDAEDFTAIQRKVTADAQKHNVNPDELYLEEGTLALKQFYALRIIDPANLHAVSDSVDPFWHAHILHTKQYEEFCASMYGSFFHHYPLNHENTEQVAAVSKLYKYTSDRLREFFNYVNPEFFPKSVPDIQLVCLGDKNPVRCNTIIPAVQELQFTRLFGMHS